MSNNRAHFTNFIDCKGVGQVGNNEVISSCSLGTGLMMTGVDGEQHWVTPNKVVYTPRIMHNLILLSPVRQNHLLIGISDDPRDRKCGRIILYQKTSGEVKMGGFETRDGLFAAVTRVCCPDQAHISRMESECVWHRRLVQCSDEILRASVGQVREIEESDFGGTGD